MKEKLKNKNVIAGLIVGVVAIIGIVILVVINMNSSVLQLKNKKVIVEYGQKISLEAKDYLKEGVDSKIIKETKVTMKEDVAYVDNKEYLEVSDYTVVLSYEKDTAEVKVSVKDNVAPEFKDFKDTIETAKDVTPDYTKLYSATDLSDITITCDDQNVKYDTVGEYKATVKATDASKNELAKEIIVKVVEPTIKLDKETETLYVKETLVLKPTITGKEQTATYKSSNEKVATVDQDGKVTAKSSGTANITISANGKDTTCKVTVKETPKGATTTTKKDNNGNTVTVVKPSNPGSSSSGSGTSINPQLSNEAISLVNAERAKLGKSALVYDSRLGSIAKKRAVEILSDFSHAGLDKYDPNHRLGECIGHGYSTPAQVVNAWMNSKGHRKILMDEYDIGDTKIAIARQGDFWVAITSK